MISDKSCHNGANLEQFLLLAKSAKGAAASALVRQVLEAQNIYVFGELLNCDSIFQLKTTEHEPSYNLLRLFAYGTCRDYMANKNTLPELSPAMIKKLRQLTLASLAAQHKQLSYSLLLTELDLHNVRELEDLIIEAIYAGVIRARMDQKCQQLEVHYALGRDVDLAEIPKMLGILQQWTSTCQDTLGDIQYQIQVAQQKRTRQLELNDKTEKEIINIKKTLKVTTAQDRVLSRTAESAMEADSKAAKPSAKGKGLRGSGNKLFKSTS